VLLAVMYAPPRATAVAAHSRRRYAVQNQLMLYAAKRLSPTLFIIINQVQPQQQPPQPQPQPPPPPPPPQLPPPTTTTITASSTAPYPLVPQTKLLAAALFAFVLLRRTFSSLRYKSCP
jgi:hypothetical protein